MQRPVEDFHQRGDAGAGRGVSRLGGGELIEEGIGDHLQAAQTVIENQHGVRQHKHRIRNA